jgi:hypothetical protein
MANVCLPRCRHGLVIPDEETDSRLDIAVDRRRRRYGTWTSLLGERGELLFQATARGG